MVSAPDERLAGTITDARLESRMLGVPRAVTVALAAERLGGSPQDRSRLAPTTEIMLRRGAAMPGH
jgi:hypothetical protein